MIIKLENKAIINKGNLSLITAKSYLICKKSDNNNNANENAIVIDHAINNKIKYGNDNQQLRHGHHQRPTKAKNVETLDETRQPVHHLQQLPREEASV